MITFYRTARCVGCAEIDDTLTQMSVAHKTVVLGPEDKLPAEITTAKNPPVLVDGDDMIQGAENIVQHLQELADFKALWEKFQSDACYCGEDE